MRTFVRHMMVVASAYGQSIGSTRTISARECYDIGTVWPGSIR
jgi:hypothetical protein